MANAMGCDSCRVFLAETKVIRWTLPPEVNALPETPRTDVKSPTFTLGCGQFSFSAYREEWDHFGVAEVGVEFSAPKEIKLSESQLLDYGWGWKNFTRWNDRPAALLAWITLENGDSCEVSLSSKLYLKNPLFEDERLADVVFDASDGSWMFTAHKSILAIQSEYFMAMFRSEMIESQARPDGKIHVKLDPDVDQTIFRLLMEFLYNGYLENEKPELNISGKHWDDAKTENVSGEKKKDGKLEYHPVARCSANSKDCKASTTFHRLYQLPVVSLIQLAYLSDRYLFTPLINLCETVLKIHLSNVTPYNNQLRMQDIVVLADKLNLKCLMDEASDGSWTFPAHTSILAMQSEYFMAMFGSEMTEGKAGPDGKIHVKLDPNVGQATFHTLMKLLYNGYLESDKPDLNLSVEQEDDAKADGNADRDGIWGTDSENVLDDDPEPEYHPVVQCLTNSRTVVCR
ncbi:hypothetical protein HK102_000128 [Quaeritorhiza haematococci]|nr:hypothetical protein HK102_000128 [Quaeritorhiza haematococci]